MLTADEAVAAFEVTLPNLVATCSELNEGSEKYPLEVVVHRRTTEEADARGEIPAEARALGRVVA